jgi:regulator of chromosome condensation
MAAESGGDAGECIDVPVLVPFSDDKIFIKQISCGGNHNLALTASNEVYSWGYGDMLALGHGKEKDEPTPKKLNFKNAKIDNITVTQVAGGGQHSAIVGRVSSY